MSLNKTKEHIIATLQECHDDTHPNHDDLRMKLDNLIEYVRANL